MWIVSAFGRTPTWIKVAPELEGERLHGNQPAVLAENVDRPGDSEQTEPVLLECRLDLSLMECEQIQGIDVNDVNELSPDAVLAVALVWFKECSMIFAQLATVAGHDVEQILAGISNPADLDEAGSDPPHNYV